MSGPRPKNPLARVLAVVAALAAVGGCSPARRADSSTASPTSATPTTAALAASSSSTTSTPAALLDRWVGPPRTIGALGTGTSAAFLEISDGFLILQTGNSDNPKAFGSDITVEGDGKIGLTLAGDVLDCRDGDAGHYTWSLSPQATTLTLTASDDACAARRAAIEGAWTHTACRLEGRDCLGIVEAGTYSTNRFNPYGGFTYGQATFTLPEGWAVTYDSQAALFLSLAGDYAANADPAPWGLRAWADVAAAKQDPAACDDNAPADPSVGPGAAAIADWMTTLPTMNATRSTIELGDLTAEVVDAEIKRGEAVCSWDGGAVGLPGGQTHGNVLIVSRTSKPDPFAYGILAGQHMRIALVDVLPGRTVAIFLDDAGRPGFDALAAAAMPILESFVFSPSPPQP
jgi:hypothetical protein